MPQAEGRPQFSAVLVVLQVLIVVASYGLLLWEIVYFGGRA